MHPGLQNICVLSDPGHVVRHTGVDSRAGDGAVLETPGSSTDQFPNTIDVTDQGATRVTLKIKKERYELVYHANKNRQKNVVSLQYEIF